MAIIDKIKRLNSKDKIYLSISATFFILLFLSGFLVIPSVKEIIRIKHDIDWQRQDLEDKYAKGQNLKSLSKNLKLISPKAKSLDQAFLRKGHEVEFITALENIAAENNIKMTIGLGENKKSADKKYEVSTITIDGSGRYADLVDFLYDIEAAQFYVNIDNIEESSGSGTLINDDSRGHTENSINLKITARTFWK